MSRRARRQRVAIVGGGCAGLAAAFELSRPGRGYEVTVFQQGWRLGGKGASGRGPSGRIEEHGLHVWMGYYENAFRLMRECYDELGRDRSSGPLATWEEAFAPSGHVAAADRTTSGAWSPWSVFFPETAGRPGEPETHYDPPSVPDYLVRTAALVGKLLATTFRVEQPGAGQARGLRDVAGRLAGYAGLGGLAAVLEALRAVELVVGSSMGAAAPEQIIRPLGAIAGATRALLQDFVRERDELRRLWGVIDVALASMRGLADPKLLRENRGFDPLDRFDCREWLLHNGASEDSIQSSFVRALYDLGFAYDNGDFDRPRIAAGAAMRGSLRAFFTYRGSFFWKMQAGMGDVVFAPLYEVLKRRGVRFEFFHRLRDVRMKGGETRRPFVAGLDFDVQARLRRGSDYAPLVEVGGLPCWPAQPDWRQLEEGPRLRDAGHDFESHWNGTRASGRSVELGRDFDYVVLAVGVGALPHVARQLVASDDRWRVMVDRVKTVPTRAFQLWLKPTIDELGWTKGSVSLTGFRAPFDTWADMTHLGKAEAWRARPGTIAYFCSVLADPGPVSRTHPEAEAARVRREAISFLNNEIGHLWPAAWRRPGEFRWDLLQEADRGRPSGAWRDERAFDTQFWRANVSPTDRYTLSLPGSIEHRISPLDVPVENMTVAGDWTECGLNLGCVEAAVMSGLLASHAISQAPSLSSIVGYRHP
ncbi:MAG TPA: FAD-dependent oxidoreductase [Polyangia bacterium]|nr:FAD-dependent oxidoreductase [Polyangia bacterium]